MKVLKFGGSSVANATNISRVLDIVESAAAEDRVMLVCSAISGCTDALLAMAEAPDRRARADALLRKHLAIVDRLFTGAERVSVSSELRSLFDELACAPADECQTFGELFSTRIIARKLACEDVRTLWLDSRMVIVRGNESKTFANVESAVRHHPEVRVFVAPGFIAHDESGKTVDLGRGGSDYSAALFAAGTGARDLQIWTDVPGIMTSNPKVVAAARTIPRMPYAAALCMAEHGAKVLYAPTIAPAMAAGIAINIRNTFDPANPGTVIDAVPEGPVCEWMGVSNMSVGSLERICLSASGPIDAEAAVSRAAAALREAGIAPVAVSQEPGCILFDVVSAVAREACRAIHKEFFESAKLTAINLYIAGKGNVGGALRDMVLAGGFESCGKELHLVEISSARDFASRVRQTAPRRSVFVDCTLSEDIYEEYVPLLEAGINIVSSNRRSLSVPYVKYAAMKRAALRNGCFLRYGTTVGNALPILESVDAGRTGAFLSIEAVLSCTLNHIITGYDGANTESFATLLRRAQDAGLTEKDPRTDLGGRDALRKLLIIAREAGVPLDEADVQITPMLPAEFFGCSLEEFYARLEASEPDFIRREAELDALGKRQRFVASLFRDASAPHGFRAEIKMQLVGVESPFYWISGTENVMILRSGDTAPLIVRGAGEGAREAAAGVLNDILK